MMDRTGNPGGGLIAGFVLGSLVGAGMALLLAPATGAETRRRVGRAARDAGEKARSLAVDLGHELKDGARDAKSRLDGMRERVARGVDDVRHDIDEALDAGRDAARP